MLFWCYFTAARRNRIGRSRVRRKLVFAFRADRDLADGKALAEPEQPAFGIERARPGFLQEIDAQVRGHRERHPSDRGEHGDVHRCVRQGHQGRARDRSARAQRNAPALLRETRNGIALLTMNRPEQRNTLSEAMLASFAEVLAQIAADRAVRAVVLAANGPVFCAGHDLKELTARRADADGGKSYFQYIMETCCSVMQAIVGLPQPVIAAVQGLATAAGCQLVASCDLAVASAQAKFCTPGVDIGLFC